MMFMRGMIKPDLNRYRDYYAIRYLKFFDGIGTLMVNELWAVPVKPGYYPNHENRVAFGEHAVYLDYILTYPAN